MDRLADAINTIKNNEYIGRIDCEVISTKLVKAVLDVMQKENYITGYEEFADGHIRKLKIKLANNINNMGVIKPRHAIAKTDIQRYEERYIPSRDFGILIISTSKGIMTNKEAKSIGIGGRLLTYVY